jgi:hypothetical protein
MAKSPGGSGESGEFMRIRADPSKIPDPKNISVLSFDITLVQGRVSVSYLETYEDAGKLELYVSNAPDDYSNNGGIYNGGGAAYKKVPPSSGFVGKSVYIDTYNPRRHHSEIVTKTLHMDAHGRFLIHIRHVPLPGKELQERGGDKVKILGVSSC